MTTYEDDNENTPLTCDFCKEKVINRLFWVVERAAHDTLDDEGHVAISVLDLGEEDKNVKYQRVICQTCVKAGRWKEIEFN